jgi:hypothetical protein
VSDAGQAAPLATEAEVLAQAVRRHARVLGGQSELPETAAAINALREATRHYVAAVMSQTGWANVFADLERGVPAAPGEGTPDSAGPDQDQPVVTYRSRYQLRIRDYQAARQLLQARAEAAGLTLGEDFDDSSSGIVAALAELDGWDPYVYDQEVIEVVSVGWEAEAG